MKNSCVFAIILLIPMCFEIFSFQDTTAGIKKDDEYMFDIFLATGIETGIRLGGRIYFTDQLAVGFGYGHMFPNMFFYYGNLVEKYNIGLLYSLEDKYNMTVCLDFNYTLVDYPPRKIISDLLFPVFGWFSHNRRGLYFMTRLGPAFYVGGNRDKNLFSLNGFLLEFSIGTRF